MIVRDRDFAEEFNQSVAKVLSRRANRIILVKNKGNVYYETKYSSKALGVFLEKPLVNLNRFIGAYPAAFLRGLFSADGCASVSVRNSQLRAEVILSNTDRRLLEHVRGILRRDFRIHSIIYIDKVEGASSLSHGRVIVCRKPAFDLRIQKFADVCVFVDEVGFAIRRKQEAITVAIDLIRRLGRLQAAELWKRTHLKTNGHWVPSSELNSLSSLPNSAC